MPQTLILIERASDIPNIEPWVRHFSGSPASGHVRIVLMKGRLQGEYPFVIRVPWHLRRNPQRMIAYIQDQFPFQVLIHVGRYAGLRQLLSEACRYIHLNPLGCVHGLASFLFWERNPKRLNFDNRVLKSGSAPLHACIACFSEKGVADQFKPLKARRTAWVYDVPNYAVIYLGDGQTRKEVSQLTQNVLKIHDRCVLVVKNRFQKFAVMAQYAFNKHVVIMDGKNSYHSFSILKKCTEVFVPTHMDALIGVMLEKKVRVYGANGVRVSLTLDDRYKSILPGYCVVPSSFLFEEGFLPHLIQADISRGPVLDGTWACRLDARGENTQRSGYQRKIKKFIADPERFFQDSKKGWLRQLGRMVFKSLCK